MPLNIFIMRLKFVMLLTSFLGIFSNNKYRDVNILTYTIALQLKVKVDKVANLNDKIYDNIHDTINSTISPILSRYLFVIYIVIYEITNIQISNISFILSTFLFVKYYNILF